MERSEVFDVVICERHYCKHIVGYADGMVLWMFFVLFCKIYLCEYLLIKNFLK